MVAGPLQIGIAATFNLAMLVPMHRWAIIPDLIVFILLGNTSSVGGVISCCRNRSLFLNHAAQRLDRFGDPHCGLLPAQPARCLHRSPRLVATLTALIVSRVNWPLPAA